ncbi:MAG: BC1872 family protein [Planctomycetota bacterium]|jgi:hypothetical protein
MTTEEFLALDPREQDALVAEKVMGWEYGWDGMDGNCWSDADGKQTGYGSGGSSMAGARSRPFTPTTQIAPAWEVVERMEADGWSWSLEQIYNDRLKRQQWRFRVGRAGVGEEDIWVYHEAWHDDVKVALNLAALKAKGVVT